MTRGGMLFMVLVIAAGCAHTQRDAPGRIAPLRFMAGSWRTAPGETITEEHWTRPAGETMLGVARTFTPTRTVFFEYLRVERTSEGVIQFVAQPRGAPPTAFRLVRVTEGEAVFENIAHDFPQRITYTVRDRVLTTRVEGSGHPTETTVLHRGH